MTIAARRSFLYDAAMLHDAAWHARTHLVFSGALRIWGVRGTVARDPDDAAQFVILPASGPRLAIRHRAPAGWTLILRDPAPGAPGHVGHHAGLPGLLRRLREELAPDAPAGRLVIGMRPGAIDGPREP